MKTPPRAGSLSALLRPTKGTRIKLWILRGVLTMGAPCRPVPCVNASTRHLYPSFGHILYKRMPFSLCPNHHKSAPVSSSSVPRIQDIRLPLFLPPMHLGFRHLTSSLPPLGSLETDERSSLRLPSTQRSFLRFLKTKTDLFWRSVHHNLLFLKQS
jgi:hypothetical protein